VDRQKPKLTQQSDAIIRVTTTTIGGSDLNIYHNALPGTEKDVILGHECMGIVEEVGSDVKNISKGQRVVVSAVLADGTCDFCKKEQYSLCETTNPTTGNPDKPKEAKTSFLGANLTGGQAEYIRVPFADVNLLHVPDSLPDEKVLFLSDVLCTAWHANELGKVGEGSTVAIWGCGPIGLTCAMWAKNRGAKAIVIIDCVTHRLELAKNLFGCQTINFKDENPQDRVYEILPEGPSVSIDAVGFRYSKSWMHTVEKALHMTSDSIDSLVEAINTTRKGGRVVMIGDYVGNANHFPVGVVMKKGLVITGSQVYVQKYWKMLLEKIEKKEIDTSFLVSKTLPLEQVADAYKQFDEKNQVLKILLKPE